MKTKQCPYCNKFSYSASDCSKWICPNCSKDISNEKIKDLNNKYKIN
ncbi:MAG: hypothetical protein ACOCRO_11520 [Halanaerobiales bacterium]